MATLTAGSKWGRSGVMSEPLLGRGSRAGPGLVLAGSPSPTARLEAHQLRRGPRCPKVSLSAVRPLSPSAAHLDDTLFLKRLSQTLSP